MKLDGIQLACLCWYAGLIKVVSAFSVPPESSSTGDASYSLFDRFRSSCPAELSCIQAFDESIIGPKEELDGTTWAAVFRSSNNKPSVFVKDEFLNAMKSATSQSSATVVDDKSNELIETNKSPYEEVPVAVARLRPSCDFENTWILDSMRCLLKKEDTNNACDGGSEHAEALGVGIDALLLHHLNSHDTRFEGAVRTKATLVSSAILEDRGFRPVQSLSRDMATHVSSIDACIEGYSKRTVMQGAKNPGARDRALRIINLLGRLDVDEEQKRQASLQQDANQGDDEDFDPWAGIKQFI